MSLRWGDDELGDQERALVIEAVVRKDRAGQERAQEVIRDGLYPKYIGHPVLPRLIERRPELVLDGEFFSVSYSDVPVALRKQVIEQVTMPVKDLLWISLSGESSGYGAEWRNMLARTAASLRLLSSWRS